MLPKRFHCSEKTNQKIKEEHIEQKLSNNKLLKIINILENLARILFLGKYKLTQEMSMAKNRQKHAKIGN